MIYGIWCKERGVENRRGEMSGDWHRELGEGAILAFESKREACKRAAREYVFDTYSEAKRKGWCEVRPLRAPRESEGKGK